MYIRQLTGQLKEKAKIEVNEDETRMQDDIQHIKDWLKKQPHLRARQDDLTILSFLRGCKYSLEKTKEKLDFYYTVRSMVPELFTERDPLKPEIQTVIKKGLILPLHNKGNQLSPRVVLMRMGGYDTEKVKLVDIYKTNLMLTDIGLTEDYISSINGVIVIYDLKNITMSHVPTPLFAKKFISIMHQGYPTRPKALHFINIPSFFETLFNLFKEFLPTKLKSRIQVHTNETEDLFKIIPQKIFPNEYGGEAGTIAEMTEIYIQKMESYREWFIEDAKYGCDESKRPGSPKTSEELFGIEGSFRKLNVD